MRIISEIGNKLKVADLKCFRRTCSKFASTMFSSLKNQTVVKLDGKKKLRQFMADFPQDNNPCFTKYVFIDVYGLTDLLAKNFFTRYGMNLQTFVLYGGNYNETVVKQVLLLELTNLKHLEFIAAYFFVSRLENPEYIVANRNSNLKSLRLRNPSIFGNHFTAFPLHWAEFLNIFDSLEVIENE